MTELTRNFSLEEMDKQSLMHPATSIADHLKNGPMIVSDGHGTRVKDRKGRELIDFGAGLWCVNIGYGRKELAKAAYDQMLELLEQPRQCLTAIPCAHDDADIDRRCGERGHDVHCSTVRTASAGVSAHCTIGASRVHVS